MAEPGEGIRAAGPEDRSGHGGPACPPRARGRAGGQPVATGARRARADARCVGRPAPRAGGVHDLRLRPRRRLGRPEGLRRADPGGDGTHGAHRDRRRPGEDRHLRRRHRGRFGRVHRCAGGDQAPRPDRGSATCTRLLFGALAEWMAYPLYYTDYGGTAPEPMGTAHPRSRPTAPCAAPTANGS